MSSALKFEKVENIVPALIKKESNDALNLYHFLEHDVKKLEPYAGESYRLSIGAQAIKQFCENYVQETDQVARNIKRRFHNWFLFSPTFLQNQDVQTFYLTLLTDNAISHQLLAQSMKTNEVFRCTKEPNFLKEMDQNKELTSDKIQKNFELVPLQILMEIVKNHRLVTWNYYFIYIDSEKMPTIESTYDQCEYMDYFPTLSKLTVDIKECIEKVREEKSPKRFKELKERLEKEIEELPKITESQKKIKKSVDRLKQNLIDLSSQFSENPLDCDYEFGVLQLHSEALSNQFLNDLIDKNCDLTEPILKAYCTVQKAGLQIDRDTFQEICKTCIQDKIKLKTGYFIRPMLRFTGFVDKELENQYFPFTKVVYSFEEKRVMNIVFLYNKKSNKIQQIAAKDDQKRKDRMNIKIKEGKNEVTYFFYGTEQPCPRFFSEDYVSLDVPQEARDISDLIVAQCKNYDKKQQLSAPQ